MKNRVPIAASVTAVIATLAVIGISKTARHDTFPSVLQASTPTADVTRNLIIGERKLLNIAPVANQAKSADYVMRVRIGAVSDTRFNTTDGARPAGEDESLELVIATPLVVDVLEYYKIPQSVTPPNGWVLLMLGGTLDQVTVHNSGYAGEEIKNIGTIGVVFSRFLDVESGELATPENVEPIHQFAMDLAEEKSTQTNSEYDIGIIFNWYLLENGQAISYHDNRTISESDLIQEIADGVQ